jgi:PAS domain S-box-containing protein
MDAPYCEFSLKEGDELAVYAFTDNQPFLKGDRVRRGDAPLAWQAHDTGKPAIVDDYWAWAHHRSLYDHLMLRAAADLPLMVGENCVGMLSMAREIKGYPFSPDDVQKGMVIAQLAAVILENTHLHETASREIQDRRQTEEALRESTRRYDDLVRNIPVMVYRVRRTPQGEYHFDYVSPRVRQINGVEPEDVRQNPDLLYGQVHPEDRDEFMRLDEESDQSLTTFLWEGRFIINGQVRWMHLESRPVSLDDGTVVWDGIELDLTDQKEAEIALQDSRRFIERVTNTVPDLIYVYDMIEQRAIYRNRDITAALGYSPEEAQPIIADPRTLLHPEDREREAENPKRYQLAKDGEVIGTEYRVRHKNGEWRWMFRRETVYERTADGLPCQILGIAQDVTDRKKFELELREREHQYRALFEQSKDAVAIVDMTGAIKRANQQAAEMFGFTLDELVGMNPTHLVVAEEVSESADVIAALRSGEKVPTYERKFQRKDKSVFTAEVNVAFVYDTLGNPSHIQSIVHDISARKAAEEERMQLLAKLQIANRDLQDFAYIISHDLKAPLRGISSVMSWLTSDYSHLLDEDGRELIALLNGRVERMEQMINGVLEYSRVGRDAEKRIAVDLNRLVGEVKADVDPEERVEVIIETPLPTLVIEPTRIRQVFQNLLDNAVKFIDKPEGEIRVGCKPQDDCWVFWVQDNGPGIEQRHFERIFQIFQTLTPRDQMENTGIGLSIVKRIIELYEGEIWLESTIGKGSTFFFSLPKNDAR